MIVHIMIATLSETDNVLTVKLSDSEINCILVLPDDEGGQEILKYIKESTPFFKDVSTSGINDDESCGVIYIPNYRDYMRTIRNWLCIQKDILNNGDITTHVLHDNVRNKTYAFRIVMSNVCGGDMYITLYVPMTTANSIEVDYFMQMSNDEDDERAVTVSTVNRMFAQLHPKNFEYTGRADVEECIYINTIQVPRRLTGQSVETWMDDGPKYVEWKEFFTRDL